MRWNTVLLSLIAALALPVVGLVTGRVVGDFFLRGDLIGAVGAGFGVLVYALALASSYSHLRHYYQGYEAQGVRASWALALAVEVATFYMSFAYVVIQSPWAFWGARTGRLETTAQPARAEAALHGAFPEQTLAFVSAEAVETRISQVRQEVRAVSKQSPGGPVHRTGDEPLPRQTVYEEHPEVRPVTLPTQEGHEATSGQDFPLSEADQEVLRLAAAGPVGPSSVSRALGIAKSSASDRLRRLERMGLLVRQGSSYLATR
jgi:uncharacterized membrane protein